MLRFFMDKFIWVIIEIGSIFFVCQSDSFAGKIILSLPIIIMYTYFSKALVFLPLDLLIGKRTKVMYFNSQPGPIDHWFFKFSYSLEWDFIYSEKGKNHKVKLIIPASMSLSDTERFERPNLHEKIRVTYYPLTKVLCNWERVD